MSETNPNENFERDFAFFSLNHFYKTCMKLVSKSSHEFTKEKEETFISCYKRLGEVFRLTHKILSIDEEKSNLKEESDII